MGLLVGGRALGFGSCSVLVAIKHKRMMFCRFPMVLLFQLSSKTPPELRYSCIPCSSEQVSFACLSSKSVRNGGTMIMQILNPELITHLISRSSILPYLEFTDVIRSVNGRLKWAGINEHSHENTSLPLISLGTTFCWCACVAFEPFRRQNGRLKAWILEAAFRSTLLPMPKATLTTPEQDTIAIKEPTLTGQQPCKPSDIQHQHGKKYFKMKCSVNPSHVFKPWYSACLLKYQFVLNPQDSETPHAYMNESQKVCLLIAWEPVTYAPL